MEVNCSRCNRVVEKKGLTNHLCERCQDIVEFGYHSFPAYHLDEKQKISEEEQLIK